MTLSFEEIRLLADLAREKGIEQLTVDGVTLRMLPLEAKHDPKKPVDPDLCRCGHSLANEHMNGLCVVGGCSPTVCAPAE